jgi:choline dehydrogenase-like flavoprotein
MLTGTPGKHMKGRAKCHYCGNCGEGCDVGAMFNSPVSTLPVAAATGRMTLRPNSVVREITIDTNTGKANGVAFVDRVTHAEMEARGRIIIVAASTLESTRLLLNSKSPQYQNGLGNSSGALGHYLMDHFGGISAGGFFKELKGRTPPPNEDGKASGLVIPRFRNINKATKQSKFIRGYHFECWSSTPAFPGMARGIRGFGSKFKDDVREVYTAGVGMTVRAEMLPRRENYVEIDPSGVVDAWGVPVLKVHIEHSDNERAMARDSEDTSREILEAAGVEITYSGGQLTVPGRIIHELGTARMGSDRKTSVLNKYNQLHDVNNVFVTDGAAFVSCANQNPTLTILALTMRACDYIADERRRSNL